MRFRLMIPRSTVAYSTDLVSQAPQFPYIYVFRGKKIPEVCNFQDFNSDNQTLSQKVYNNLHSTRVEKLDKKLPISLQLLKLSDILLNNV